MSGTLNAQFYSDNNFSCFQAQFPQRLQFLKFLTLLWSRTVRQKLPSNSDDVPVPSALVVIQSLHAAKVLVQSFDEEDVLEITSDKSQGN